MASTSSSSSSVFDIKEHIIEASHIREYPHATAHSQDESLLLHVKQYIPRRNTDESLKGDLSIIGTHANGFPKELYEPLYEDFVEEAEKLGIRIRSIWIADAAHQGRSGILNEDKLGNDPGWLDYARDIIHLINTVRMPRPIFAMGHSFGGNALTNVSLMHPRLFSGMVLLDPVIARAVSDKPNIYSGPASLSINRRDVWPSRQTAAQAFHKNRFYQSWDPRTLDRWIQFGLRDVDTSNPNGPVQLTTTKHQEVFTFVRPAWPAYDPSGKHLVRPDLVPDLDLGPDSDVNSNPVSAYRPEGHNTVAHLPLVRPGVLYVFGGKSDVCPPESRHEKLQLTGTGIGGSGGVAKGRVKAVTGPDNGHLIPLENPRFCAQAAVEWAKSELDRWWAEEKEFEEWAKKPAAEKVTISDKLRRHLAQPKRDNAKEKAKI